MTAVSALRVGLSKFFMDGSGWLYLDGHGYIEAAADLAAYSSPCSPAETVCCQLPCFHLPSLGLKKWIQKV